MKRLILGFVAAAFTVVPPTIASASVVNLTLDGGWSSFSFAGLGSSGSDSFSFTVSTGQAYFVVTDAFCTGDRFAFSINGVAAGTTSVPFYDGSCVDGVTRTDNADVALAGIGAVSWSKGQALLGPGTYSVTGSTVSSPFGGGSAFAKLSSTDSGAPGFGTVPEPASIALVGFSLAGLLASRGRKAVSASA